MEEGGEWVTPARRWGKTDEEGAEGSRDPPPQTMISNQDPSPTAPSAPPLQPRGGGEPANPVQQHHWDLPWLGQGKKVTINSSFS